jgi:hypothetical protein
LGGRRMIATSLSCKDHPSQLEFMRCRRDGYRISILHYKTAAVEPRCPICHERDWTLEDPRRLHPRTCECQRHWEWYQ